MSNPKLQLMQISGEAVTREAELEFCLRQIISMLPRLSSDKQWLDPSIEAMARDLLGVDHRGNPLPNLQDVGRVRQELHVS